MEKRDPRLAENQTLMTDSPYELAAVYDYGESDEDFYSSLVRTGRTITEAVRSESNP